MSSQHTQDVTQPYTITSWAKHQHITSLSPDMFVQYNLNKEVAIDNIIKTAGILH